MRYQSTTGLDSDQIDELVDRIEEIECGRKSGHGRPVVVDLYGQVVIALVLLRQNLNQMAVADLFGISQPTVSRIYRTILPLLKQVTCLHAPDFAKAVHNRVVLVDGTDVPTGNRRNGRENYSGKRHRQGLNIQVGASLEATLLGVADPVPGCRHDRRAITETGWEDILGHGHWIADPGYLGTTAITPEKKPKNGESDPKTKDNNKLISEIRSAVERCIAHPNANSNTVTPIDVATNTPGNPIPAGANPVGIAITPTPPATSTSTQLSVDPHSPATAGTTETLTATITPAAVAGSVQFAEATHLMGFTTPIGNPVTVTNGSASMTTTLPQDLTR